MSTNANKGFIEQTKTQIAEVNIDLSVLNAKTKEVIISELGEGVASKTFNKVLGFGGSGTYDEALELDALRYAMVDAMENIVKALNEEQWTCDIVKISKDSVYLNAGKKSGIKKGDSLGLYMLGEEIRDTDGSLIAYEEEKIDQLVVERFIGEDASVAKYSGTSSLKLPMLCKFE